MKRRVFTFGETMALFRAGSPGGIETTSEAKIGIGGADSNVAIGLSRLGVSTQWVGRVGDDSLGRRIQRELRAEGIDTHVIVDPAPTGLMIKDHRTPHTTQVLFYRRHSAGSRLAPKDISRDMIAHAGIVHITGITASLSSSAEDATFTAIQYAREEGAQVSFDVNHRPRLWLDDDPAPLYRKIAKSSDIIFAGSDEARLLLGQGISSNSTWLACELAELGPREVIIKLGADGCVADISGQAYTQPAVPVTVVDTVGAGDAFVAGYLAALIEGADPAARLRRAATVAAFSCLNDGDWEGLPRQEDLHLLETQDPVDR
ncbi:sugar kinase [Arthrobacter sp. 24S4-2]|uniref:sugar kinase n=1 Tax=Arthrobacter sp. 24S4-2 TaxID=2575374 RepID=UPI0010C77981|nr:sugar kinase [Arthrobacter sp. 24S4-2]QCP00064.1 sugar kinase [Arthrobacter sp. 24S4-2]